MNIKLITLEQAKIVFEVQIETGEHKKNNEMNKIFIGQNLWNNNQIVGQITNINFDNLSHNFEQNEPEKFDLKPKKVEIKIENVKIENESKILTIECFGDFKNCKWKSEWKFDTDFVLSPRIWEKNDNLPDLDEELKVNLKTNLEIQKNPKNLENKNLTNKNNFENQKIEPNSFQKMAKNEVEKQKNQNQKYYFIPTVQKFETVKMGQKLGFVEVCGNLYWLICPSWEPQYQIQIESGEFETSSKIGVLIGKKIEYELTLEQNLNFNFTLIPQKSKEVVPSGIPLFDLFCPFIQGSKTILHNFSPNEITSLLTNLDQNFPAKPIIITDLDFFAPELNIFKTDNWLELTKYFALCGINIIVVLGSLPLDFENYLDFFASFETIGGEICAVSLFWIFDEKNSENEIQNEKNTKLKYFENYWKLNKKVDILEKNYAKKITQSLGTDYRKINQNLTRAVGLPDLINSFGAFNSKNLLLDNIHKQNSPFVNQIGKKSSLNNLKLELADFTNPFYELIMAQNNQNIEESLTLWEFFCWTKMKFGKDFGEEFEPNLQNSFKTNSNQKSQLPKMEEKIRQNWQKLKELIEKILQKVQNIEQNTIEIKSEISKILE